MSVPHTKGRKIICTCVKDHSIDEKEQYKAIGLSGLIIDHLKKRRVGGTRELLDGHPYLKHLIQLWTGDWVKQMAKMNEAVVMNNRLTMVGIGKWIVHPFKSQEL